jgi:hypothetical protein
MCWGEGGCGACMFCALGWIVCGSNTTHLIRKQIVLHRIQRGIGVRGGVGDCLLGGGVIGGRGGFLFSFFIY